MNTNNIISPFVDNGMNGSSDVEVQPEYQKSAYSSPFQNSFEGEFDSDYSPESEFFVEMMDELYDEEFEEVLHELSIEVNEVYQNNLSRQLHQNEFGARQNVLNQFNPYINEIDQHLSYVESLAGKYDNNELTPEEFIVELDQFDGEISNPVFDQFFKKAFKKIKRGIKKVVNKGKKFVTKAIKKGAGLVKKGLKFVKDKVLGPIINKLKGVVKKFLKMFLEKAISKLPPHLQPIARKLAKKFGNKAKKFLLKKGKQIWNRNRHIRRLRNRANAFRSRFGFEQEYVYNPSDFELELDGMMAEVFMSENEAESALIVDEYVQFEVEQNTDVRDFDLARERFIDELANLEEGEEGEGAEVAIENFLPAVMMILKWGIKIVGRKKVINLLSKLLSKLISKLVGPQFGPMLSGIIVNTGFRLLNLEVTPDQEHKVGPAAIANVIEDTLRELGEIDDEVLEDSELLESYVVSAFEKAASKNLPEMLAPEEYLRRPDLKGAFKHKVSWVTPFRFKQKPWSRLGYKKLNKVFDAELTPHIANEIKTTGGMALSNVLNSHYGMEVGNRMPVRVHLYETLPFHSRLDIINKDPLMKRRVGKMSSKWKLLHPLTSKASGILLGEPKLGCGCGKCLKDKMPTKGGQRYYYLEIPNNQLEVFESEAGVVKLKDYTSVHTKLDFINNNVKLSVHLNEMDAQNTADHIRNGQVALAHQSLYNVIKGGLRNALMNNLNIRVLHPSVTPNQDSASLLDLIPTPIVTELYLSLRSEYASVITNYLKTEGASIIEKADNEANGVTIELKVHASSLASLRKYLDTDVVEFDFSDVDISIKAG